MQSTGNRNGNVVTTPLKSSGVGTDNWTPWFISRSSATKLSSILNGLNLTKQQVISICMCQMVSKLIEFAFITGNSSLEPLLEGLFAQIHVNLSGRVFGRNWTGGLRITKNFESRALHHWAKVTDRSPKIPQDPLSYVQKIWVSTKCCRLFQIAGSPNAINRFLSPKTVGTHPKCSHYTFSCGFRRAYDPLQRYESCIEILSEWSFFDQNQQPFTSIEPSERVLWGLFKAQSVYKFPSCLDLGNGSS